MTNGKGHALCKGNSIVLSAQAHGALLLSGDVKRGPLAEVPPRLHGHAAEGVGVCLGLCMSMSAWLKALIERISHIRGAAGAKNEAIRIPWPVRCSGSQTQFTRLGDFAWREVPWGPLHQARAKLLRWLGSPHAPGVSAEVRRECCGPQLPWLHLPGVEFPDQHVAVCRVRTFSPPPGSATCSRLATAWRTSWP